MSSRVLSLALKINADASGLKLDPVEKALQRLGQETDKVTAVFDKFAGTSEVAARAQEQTAKAIADLTEARRTGAITAQQFAEQFEAIADAANAEASALQRAAQITEQNLTPLERYDRTLAELNEQLNAGRISQETYSRAVEGSAKGLNDAERAARGLAVQQKEIDKAATSTTLKFNELSGVFSVLPGPLGNIAGRISGISSASEGLSRVFSGGLTQGFSSIAASVTSLVNPLTAAIAGITAFAAGATAVARGLIDLEDRVERLGNLADQLGVSFEFIQVLEEAGKRTGVSVESVSSAMTRLQRALAGADEESKKSVESLGRLGISVADLEGLSEQAKIELIGRQIAAIEDPAKRTAAAVELFGRSGVQLLPFFNQLGAAANDIERYGRALSELDRQRLDDFGSGLDALSLATQGLGQSLLLPFTGLAEGISFAGAEITAGITAIVDPIGRVLEPVFTNIGRIIETIGQGIGNLGRVIGAVFEPFAVVVQEVSTALQPLYDLIFDFLGSFGEAAVATTEWIVSFTPIGAIAENVGALGETISRVVTIITTAFSRVGEFIGGLVSRFGDLLAQSPLLQSLGNIISQVFGSVSSVFGTIAEAIGGTVGRLLTLAENFLGIDRSAQSAAEATSELAAEVAALTEEEQKAAADREKFLQGFADNVSRAIDESAKFGQAGFDAALQYQTAIAELQSQFDRGILNEESFRREAEKASQAYQAQLDVIKQSAAETEAVTARVDGLLAKANQLTQSQQDLNAVEAEIARVQAAIVQARAEGQSEQATALAARLAQLDQLQAGLQQQADEAAQGFDRGFDAAFANVESGISTLIDKAGEFGNEGALAAVQLQQGIAAAQEQVRDGILTREAFDREVERQRELFNQRIEQLREAEAEAKRLEDERFAEAQRQVQALADQRQRVNEFVDQQLALQQFGGDNQRLEASRRVAEIEAEIARVQQEIEAARAGNDEAAVQAGVERIGQLDQVAAKERDIANGRAKFEEQIAKQREAIIKQQEEAAKAQEQAASQAAEQQRKAFEEQAKAAAAEAERQEKRIRALNSIGQQSIGGNDIRTSQGASQFLQLAAGAFDPNLAEARAQTKLLRSSNQALQRTAEYLELGIGRTFQFLGGGA